MKLIRRLRTNTLAFIGALAIAAILLIAVFAPLIVPYDPIDVQTADRFLPPGRRGHILGTDFLGRDVFSRIIFGSRVSLLLAGLSVVLGALLGVTAGVLAGFTGGWVDTIVMRITDVIFSIPSLMIALGVVGLVGRSMEAVVIALGVAYSPLFALVCHSAVVGLREMGFVEASRAIGSSRLRILWKDIVPNILPLIMVQATTSLSWAILAEASLGFLGMSVEPPTPSWGTMLTEGREYFYSGPTVPLFAGLMVLIVVFAFNLFGDGLRDLLDPRAWERLR
ncbi:MAG: ABC transporter permease [Chloroflexi bacterium]|nr:ABC transporter permease [Chloroflexota bacterium]